MIPSTLLYCRIRSSDQHCSDVRVTDLSAISFSFRVSLRSAAHFQTAPEGITLFFYQRASGAYREVRLTSFTMEHIPEDSTDLWRCYRVLTDSADFRMVARQFMQEYLSYLSSRLDCSEEQSADQVAAFRNTGGDCCASLEEQYHEWFDSCSPDEDWLAAVGAVPELAFSLNRTDLWDSFLACDFPQFISCFWASAQLDRPPYAQITPTHLYIGNQFFGCSFPEQQTLFCILEKACTLKLTPVLVFSAVAEDHFSEIEALLHTLSERYTDGPLELVVNDLGMLALLQRQEFAGFRVSIGSLLLKRCKDPRLEQTVNYTERLQYYSTYHFSEDFLIGRFSENRAPLHITQETAGYTSCAAGYPAALHMPFYQTNTLPICPHGRSCGAGTGADRRPCRKCENHIRLYPAPLKLAGAQNSLFGVDLRSMYDGSWLKKQLGSGTERIVFEFL